MRIHAELVRPSLLTAFKLSEIRIGSDAERVSSTRTSRMESTFAGPDTNIESTAQKANESNRAFWQTQSALMQQRLSDSALYQVAFDEMRRQSVRVPLYYQKPLEMLLEEAHETRALFMSFIGRKGGKCKDRLQILIVEIVDKDPGIDCRRLLHRLKAQRTFGVISDVTDDVISFEDTGGDIVDVKITTLKHRLSRAKKEIVAKAGKSD
jgi:hypothetical protein